MMEKPFIVGNVATGEKFIGRKEYLQKLYDFTKAGNTGCLSICGLPRIGKTSIALKTFETKETEILPIYVNLSVMLSFFDLWSKIIKEIFVYLSKLGISDLFDDYKAKIESACNSESYGELRENLIDFFMEISKESYQFIIVIDEFDYIIRGKFGDKEQCGIYLNCLRDIFSQRPDLRLSLIVISRRDIASLEESGAVGSTFHGVFGNNIICVLGFNDDDYNAYLEILQTNHVQLTGKLHNDLETYGGRSPYLLAQIGNYLCEDTEIKSNINEFTRNQGMINYYNDLVKIMKNEGYFDSMIKIFVGPKYNLTFFEVKTLENLGYIYFYKDKEVEKTRALSKDFTHYLYELIMLNENQIIWPKLNEVEVLLREIITNVLTAKFGRTWENDIRMIYQNEFSADSRSYSNFIKFEKVDVYIKDMKRNYPGKKYNLLKVISIWELKNLINYFWNDGMSIHFTGIEKNELFEKMDLLQRARLPLAHSNPEYLESEEIRLAEVYCDQILKASKV